MRALRVVFGMIRAVESGLLAAAMLTMAGITIANVFARNLLASNMAAAEELNGFLIVLVCFVGLGYAASHGRHIRMTALYDQLPPAGRKVVMVFVNASTAALLFAFAFWSYTYASGVERVSPVLGVPLRLVYMLAPLGLTLGGVQYLLTLLRNLVSPGIWLAFDLPDGYEETDALVEAAGDGASRPPDAPAA